jgi:MFS family permease
MLGKKQRCAHRHTTQRGSADIDGGFPWLVFRWNGDGYIPLVAAGTAADADDTRHTDEGFVQQWMGSYRIFPLGRRSAFGLRWLGDKVGRVRVMTLSISLLAVCGLSYFASAWQLGALRFLGALGMVRGFWAFW